MSLREHHEEVLRSSPVCPSTVESLRYLVTWHTDRQNLIVARKYLAQLASFCRDDARVWLSFCVVCALAGEIEESHRSLVEVVRLTEKPEEDVLIKYCQGLLYECRGKLSEALDMYYCGIEMSDVQHDSEQLLHEEAAALGDFDTENAAFKRMTLLKDAKIEFLIRVASVQKDRGELHEAVIVADLAARNSNMASPGLIANLACVRGSIFSAQQQILQAEMSYREALLAVPGHSVALERLGAVYLRYRECVPTAVGCFAEAIESNPLSYTSWYMIGRAYMAAGRYDDALEAYHRALSIEPNVAETWCSLGILYFSQAQRVEAQGAFRRALRLDPRLAEGWYNLGVLCETQGQAREAHQCFIKSRQFGLGERLISAGVELVDSRTLTAL